MAEEKEIKCPHCETINEVNSAFCKECGLDFSRVNENDDNEYHGNITLTKDAIIMSSSKIGRKQFMHIFLKDISSIQLHYKSIPLVLILAIISLILGIISIFNYSMEDLIGLFFTLWIIFTIIFLITARYVLIITAIGGEKMIQRVGKGWKVEEFVQKVIKAQKDNI